MSSYLYRFPALPLEPFQSGLDLHRVVGAEMTIIYAQWQEGTRHENIVHDNEELFFVISGSLEASVGDEHFTMNPNDAAMIPGGVTHGFRALEPCLVLNAIAPPVTHEEAERLKNDD